LKPEADMFVDEERFGRDEVQESYGKSLLGFEFNSI
jgi:hypothetical protein